MVSLKNGFSILILYKLWSERDNRARKCGSAKHYCFNARRYSFIGANTHIIGNIYAGNYITTGKNVTITGVLGDCGGLFTTTGAITFGAKSILGSQDCTQKPMNKS